MTRPMPRKEFKAKQKKTIQRGRSMITESLKKIRPLEERTNKEAEVLLSII